MTINVVLELGAVEILWYQLLYVKADKVKGLSKSISCYSWPIFTPPSSLPGANLEPLPLKSVTLLNLKINNSVILISNWCWNDLFLLLNTWNFLIIIIPNFFLKACRNIKLSTLTNRCLRIIVFYMRTFVYIGVKHTATIRSMCSICLRNHVSWYGVSAAKRTELFCSLCVLTPITGSYSVWTSMWLNHIDIRVQVMFMIIV